jgi:hypothetical protein
VRLTEVGTIVAPLLLASAALALREVLVVRLAPVARGTPPEEFRPPPLAEPTSFAGQRRFRIDPDASRAFLCDGAGASEELRVEGELTLHPRGEWRSLEITITPTSRAPAREAEEPIVLQGFDASSRPSGVPGILQARLRARASSPGRLVETTFSAAWLRLPWGDVRLQAVAELASSFRGEEAGLAALLLGRSSPTIALELALEEDP